MLKWLFSVSARHHGGIRRYERGGGGVRALTAFLMLAFVAASLGLEWFSFSLLSEQFAVGILLFIVAICFVIATAEFCLVYAITGFRMFFWGVVVRLADRKGKRRRRSQEAEEAEEEEEEAPTRSHCLSDMLIFLLGLVCSIGVVIAAVALGVTGI